MFIFWRGGTLLRLGINGGAGFLPPIIPYLNNFSGQLWHVENGYPHPAPGLNAGWRRVVVSLEDFLDVYDAVRRGEGIEANDASKFEDRLLSRYQDFIYRSVEFIETAADKTKFALLPPDNMKQKWGSPRIAGLRRHADIICNKLKHNQHQLVIVALTHPQSIVHGYMVTQISPEGSAVPNKDIHKDREVLSFNVEIRKIVANLYLIAQEVENSAISITGVKGSPTAAQDAATEAVLRRVSELSSFVFPGETHKHMPILSFDGDLLEVEDRGGRVRHGIFDHQYRTRYVSDGHTRSYHVPFMAKNSGQK
jgi:hypothetical protein